MSEEDTKKNGKSSAKADLPATEKTESKSAASPKVAKKAEKDPYRLDEKWSSLWKIFAVVGVLGIAAAGFGYTQNPTRFAYSWLFGFLFSLTFAIGAMMWVLIQYLTSAGWSVTVRRTAEFFASGSVVFVLLVIPVIFSMNILFREWLHTGEHEEPEHAAQIDPNHLANGALAQNEAAHPPPAMADHASPVLMPHGVETHAVASSHGNPEEVIDEEIMARKTWWLSKTFFIGRACAYVLIWAFLGTWLLRRSAAQDVNKDPQLTVKTASWAPIFTILLAFSLTFAAFDWIMSLQPTWYSTIFGVNFFASSFVAIHAALIITFFSMRQSGILKKEVNVEHYHDLGKLQFGFLVFWAYISFSQFMLIWYAGIPEETTFYHLRWDDGPWAMISLGIVIAHFVIPFFLILSRNAKRKIEILRAGAFIILGMHVVELYWFVMPNVPHQESFAFHWLDVACVVGCLGIYLAVVFRNMASYSLIPTGDPRLSRALKFQNA